MLTVNGTNCAIPKDLESLIRKYFSLFAINLPFIRKIFAMFEDVQAAEFYAQELSHKIMENILVPSSKAPAI